MKKYALFFVPETGIGGNQLIFVSDATDMEGFASDLQKYVDCYNNNNTVVKITGFTHNDNDVNIDFTHNHGYKQTNNYIIDKVLCF